ncbi:ATM interactor [Bombina bombina]|uniref:ATM interactor n=1 Tax=Bombina bombina TaxID=8345 RepID=UPI00235AAEE0|nr:ATM interactor [Bombina bombina]
MAARAGRAGGTVRSVHSCEHWEIVKPSVSELCREVRSNILCTVKGCGKVLPNPPALNMHLVKSHRVQDGITDPTLRKHLKSSQKLYCCPIEGCPRGTNRPFSQFSLVKQHFMKMHAEKKHKCDKCGNSYGTEWDLKRHVGYCGKTFECTCGCPYASRTALLSHSYRTGHEIPIEHRDPPVKKRKMEASVHNRKTINEKSRSNHEISTVSASLDLQTTDTKPQLSTETVSDPSVFDCMSLQPNHTQNLLLPKLALVKLPVMQLTHLPVLVSSSDYTVKPMIVTVNSNKGSIMTNVQILPHYNGTILPTVDVEASLPSNVLLPRNVGYCSVSSTNSIAQVNADKSFASNTIPEMSNVPHKHRITSDVQTDLSYFSQNILPDVSWTSSESSVSSCSQTDLSFSAQVTLPVSVETQTLQQNVNLPLSSVMEASNPCFTYGISRETQTNLANSQKDIMLVDQAVMCENIFSGNHSSYTVSTQTNHNTNNMISNTLDQNVINNDIRDEAMKSTHFINFSTQNSTFSSQNMTDNQTQTMELLNDLEKILSDNISGQSMDNRNLLTDSGAEAHLSSNCTNNPGIDFDIEEFFSASNIQTQTDESELGNLTSEYLDIETQTDFLFSVESAQSYCNKGNSNLIGMEMFDTQTQTDLNIFLDNNSHLPLGTLLKQSSFSMSTDSSDTESHSEITSESKNISCQNMECNVLQSSAETQTTDGCIETLGHLFLTSNETQTAINDFLLADLAWNTIDSQFSSVETQTCDELFSLFSSEKSDS